MPDRILHKRSLTPGSIPLTSSLELGELAINVADGKIHIRSSGSSGDTIVSLVTANTVTTGSITATGGFTGSLQGSASYVEYVNVANKPTLLSSSAQIATDISGAFTSISGGFSTRITTVESSIIALNAATSSYVLTSQTSSMRVLSASFATTASYALNGGVTQIVAGTNISISPTGGTGAVTINSTAAGGSGTTFTASIGNGTATDIGVTHNLNSRDIIVQLYDNSTYETIICDIIRTNLNFITCSFAVAPSTNQYKVVIK